jgi:hypothetical protein
VAINIFALKCPESPVAHSRDLVSRLIESNISGGSQVLAQTGIAMNDEVQLEGNLLEELREAYRSLPRHIQIRVAGLLRESAPPEQSDVELAS